MLVVVESLGSVDGEVVVVESVELEDLDLPMGKEMPSRPARELVEP